MSETPRTDAIKAPTSFELLCQTANLARELERENAKLRERFSDAFANREDVQILRVDGLDPAMPSTITLRVGGQIGTFKHHA